MWRYVKAYLGAALITYVVGAVAITQVNLASLQAMGASVDFVTRFSASLSDLQGLVMPYFALVAIALLIGFVVTGQISRFFPLHRWWLYPLAGLVALIAMHLILKAVIGLWGVAGARPALGLVLQGLAGLVGGWLYARMSRRPNTIFID